MTALSNEALAKELLPCPFCGGDAYDVHEGGSAWFVGANHRSDCHLGDFQRTEAEVITAWNTRTPPIDRGAGDSGRNNVLDEALACQPGTAEDPNENAYERGRFDGVIEFGRAIAALKTTEPADEGEKQRKAANYDSSLRVANDLGYSFILEALDALRAFKAIDRADPENSKLVTQAEERFLILKRGLYFRPDNGGYTGLKREAGRYPASHANPLSGETAVHEDEAPEYSPTCWEETKLADKDRQLAEAQATVSRLEDALRQIELISTNHGAWFENGPWEWGQMMGDAARAALSPTTKYGHGTAVGDGNEG